MRDFHPYTQILALIALALFCFIPALRLIHMMGILFLLVAVDRIFYAIFPIKDDDT